MTIRNAKVARQVVSARLQSYIATVKQRLPTSSMEFWQRIEPSRFPKARNVETWQPGDQK